jgi:hypothetical protein
MFQAFSPLAAFVEEMEREEMKLRSISSMVAASSSIG